MGRARLCIELCPGIYLTTEENHGKTSVRAASMRCERKQGIYTPAGVLTGAGRTNGGGESSGNNVVISAPSL